MTRCEKCNGQLSAAEWIAGRKMCRKCSPNAAEIARQFGLAAPSKAQQDDSVSQEIGIA